MNMENSIKGKSFFDLTKEERKFVMDSNPPTIGALYEGNAYFGWNWTGCGFGQMTMRLDKEASKIIVDSENMGRESVRKLLHSMADYIADRAVIVDYPNDIPPISLANEVKLQEKLFQEKVISGLKIPRSLTTELRNKTTVRIKYSHSQLDALTDSQIYNQPYGMELGEEKYILAEVKKLGYNKVINSSLDDVAFEHIVEVE